MSERHTHHTTRDKPSGSEIPVATLCRFLRATYGSEALHEAQRHVEAYRHNAQRDMAAIWLSVREELAKAK